MKTLSIKQYKKKTKTTFGELGQRFGGKSRQAIQALSAKDKQKITISTPCPKCGHSEPEQAILSQESNIYTEVKK